MAWLIPQSALEWALAAGAFIAVGALLMTAWNISLYRRGPAPRRGKGPPAPAGHAVPLISVCVPARNEEANIEACVRGLLDSDLAPELVEVLVYDDESTDATPRILERIASQDPRLIRVPTHKLPEGWNGKQHACWRMAQAARGRWLLFTDADVRFEPACLRTAVERAESAGLGLLSTFPRQLTGSLAEALVVPMIHFILFAYLPMARMRSSLDPSASAACGQFLLARRDAYHASRGHAAFKESMHDGVRMPREIRKAGFPTDLFDATELCSVRMYRGLRQTWRGFTKNAYEGLGSIGLLVFITVLHLVGHVLPWVALPVLLIRGDAAPAAPAFAGVAVTAGLACRALAAWRFRLPALGVALHPVAVLLMTAIQWRSLWLHKTGRRAWRGRVAGRSPAAV
jgi:hypothetical protein